MPFCSLLKNCSGVPVISIQIQIQQLLSNFPHLKQNNNKKLSRDHLSLDINLHVTSFKSQNYLVSKIIQLPKFNLGLHNADFGIRIINGFFFRICALVFKFSRIIFVLQKLEQTNCLFNATKTKQGQCQLDHKSQSCDVYGLHICFLGSKKFYLISALQRISWHHLLMQFTT